MVDGRLACREGPHAAVTVKEDNVTRFRFTRTPLPLLVLPSADDPDLPAPRPPKKPADDDIIGPSEPAGLGPSDQHREPNAAT